ncbi:MAG: tRNA (adenosine(37)-N6)-threonylcarbamoyltransferase complex transferase subunit TsaD [Candidatus Taylorbacteria bacterium]|nr:tRNA (adenosine(37)-N6)-threonylcarbamoyltransferase complex transferase subunit TsaD [Candidatus Taylorbacteria bacterium]
MVILGIETSCDETALALIETRGQGADFECRVIGSLVHSQAELHSAYGGVYPTLAKREHGKNLIPLFHKLLTESSEFIQIRDEAELNAESIKKSIDSFRAEIAPQNPELFESFANAKFLNRIPKIDQIAVTEGPGLEPALWVGINFARMLGELWRVPVVPINHMEGHIVGSLLSSDITNGVWHKIHTAPMTAVALLISGGHTQLLEIKSIGNYKIIGETLDDAVGEAFDKAARLLGLNYPGGSKLSMLAAEAREANIEAPLKLPRPMINSKDLNFSFSGLKTAVLYAVRKAPKDLKGDSPNRPGDELDENWKKGLAREFEDAVAETLNSKLKSAIEKTDAKSVIIGGGVSANGVLRSTFEKTANEYGIPIFMPLRHVSGDNALMIALAAALDSRHPSSGKPTEKVSGLRAQGTKRLGV